MKLLDHTVRIFRLAAVFALGGMVVACGGGGGTQGALVIAPNGVATSWAGPYLSNDEGYLALAVPQGSALDMLAVRYVTSTSVVIYSGALSLGMDGAASVSGLKAMRANGSLRSGLAALTGVSATTHSAVYTLNDLSDSQEVSPLLSGQQRQALDALNGSWTGTWVDGMVGANPVMALDNVSSGATLTKDILGCRNVTISFGAYLAASGVYRTTINYLDNTDCTHRRGQTLTGWAFVHVTGGVQRLHLLAVDSRGSGISFRGSR
jgi:hypothetical protein